MEGVFVSRDVESVWRVMRARLEGEREREGEGEKREGRGKREKAPGQVASEARPNHSENELEKTTAAMERRMRRVLHHQTRCLSV